MRLPVGPCVVDPLEPLAPCQNDNDCTPLPQTWQRDGGAETLYYFWLMNIPVIVIGVCFELSLLMVTAVRSAVLVSHHIDLRLTPLNNDRYAARSSSEL